MDQAKAIEAAKLLAEARKTGVPIKELPPELRPAVAADSNQIAAEVTRMLGAQVAGWKITFLYKPREVPFQHPIYRNLMFSSPAKIPTSIAPSMFIEPEVTFRLTKDLPPREKLYNHEEVASSVDACPSMECVDTRYDTKYKTIRERLNERATLVEAYADNQTKGIIYLTPSIFRPIFTAEIEGLAMSKSTISTFQLFEMFPDQESARTYLEGRLWPNGPK
jgi:2-keto-4-pentenoate hydratase